VGKVVPIRAFFRQMTGEKADFSEVSEYIRTKNFSGTDFKVSS
jgi:hypothetical protein